MNILLTNLQMYPFRGTESWCYAVGSELIKRGHKVSIFSPTPREGIPYFEKAGINYTTTGTYDLVLENHSVIYPAIKGPVIHTCHGTVPAERPLRNVTNVAVNPRVADYWGLNTVIFNGIDCDRFRPIVPLNDKPKTVLSLCSSEMADQIIANICSKLNLNLITTHNKEVFDVERLINQADIVFGVGRSALDAMACGRPVISFDCRFYLPPRHGCGYLTPELVANNTDNLVGKDNTWTDEQIIEQIKRYNPEDGFNNRDYVINNRNITQTVDKYLEVYNDITGLA